MGKKISDWGWCLNFSRREENRRKGKKRRRKADEIETEAKQNQTRNSTFLAARVDNYSLEQFAPECGDIKSLNQDWTYSPLSKQKFWSLCRTHRVILFIYLFIF